MAASALVLGASGFAGGEVVRLLASHPGIELAEVAAERAAGRRLDELQPQLAGSARRLIRPVDEVLGAEVDVCFSCLPRGELPGMVEGLAARIVVDLADDFRADRGWVYGLTEFARGDLATAARIANPGCYPTSVLLGLVPFARRGVIRAPIVVDALSGLSGAGRALEDRLLYAVAQANACAYGKTEHRHVPEMERGLRLFGDVASSVSFTPHLVPMARGLLVTARALTELESDGDALAILESAYEDEPFVHAVEEWPSTKAVAGTNRALVSARVDRRSGWLIVSVAIDNLGKGAAGQAIQNANRALGLEETAGLEGLGVWP